jgi:glutamine phosphoribosylpyrophosphate amidotransferase
MCGIAGRLLRDPGTVGADLVAMLAAQRHRGADSTGFALYGESLANGFVVRALLANRATLHADLEALRAVTRYHGADLLEDPTWDETEQRHVSVRLWISDPDLFPEWVDACDALPGVELQSVGRALEIVKDVGDAEEVAAKHGVQAFLGTHGLGHVRLATESNVSPVAGHPFWARPFPDVAIVHNGQLTNYYKWARRLQHAGYRFTTENDSELIAVWNSDRMAAGDTLEEALHRSLREFDGVFTYLLATRRGIGLAKDRWAIKPIVVVGAEDGAAMATEEQSLRTIYRDEFDVEVHDGPSVVRVWNLEVPAQFQVAA